MKKVLAMAALALFMMTSCSDDDTTSTTPVEDNALLKKIVATSENGTIRITNYTYDGNKIISEISDDLSITYSYTGDLITHVTAIRNNNITTETSIEYNANNQKTSQIVLTSAPDFGIEEGTKETYTYNSNGTVTYNQYSGDFESQTTLEGTGTITINENSIHHEGMNFEAYTHTLDTKNNPLKNVLGYQEYAKPHFNGNHNYLTAYTTPTRSDFIFTYDYNSSNYPISSIEKTYQVNAYATTQKQYFYE